MFDTTQELLQKIRVGDARLIRFDEQTVGNAVPDDLSEVLWRRFQTGRSLNERRDDFLHKLGMVRQDDAGVARPTVAGS